MWMMILKTLRERQPVSEQGLLGKRDSSMGTEGEHTEQQERDLTSEYEHRTWAMTTERS